MPCLVTIEVTSERAPEQKLKRRTAKIRVFSNEESSERLASTVLAQIDECRDA